MKIDGNISTTTKTDVSGVLSFAYATTNWDGTHVFKISLPYSPCSVHCGSSGSTGGGGGSAGNSGGNSNSAAPVIQNPTPVIVPPAATGTESFIFTKDLEYLMTDPDVKKLQRYLNAKGVIVSASGAGSPGLETSFFGQATIKALVRFQKLRKITPASGFFGPITREYIRTH